MTPVIIGAALALLALDTTPATADSSTTVKPAVVQGSKAASNNADSPDRVVCRNEPLTGSRFTKRVCMTRAEWDDRARQVEVLERRLNQTATPTGGGGMNGN